MERGEQLAELRQLAGLGRGRERGHCTRAGAVEEEIHQRIPPVERLRLEDRVRQSHAGMRCALHEEPLDRRQPGENAGTQGSVVGEQVLAVVHPQECLGDERGAAEERDSLVPREIRVGDEPLEFRLGLEQGALVLCAQERPGARALEGLHVSAELEQVGERIAPFPLERLKVGPGRAVEICKVLAEQKGLPEFLGLAGDDLLSCERCENAGAAVDEIDDEEAETRAEGLDVREHGPAVRQLGGVSEPVSHARDLEREKGLHGPDVALSLRGAERLDLLGRERAGRLDGLGQRGGDGARGGQGEVQLEFLEDGVHFVEGGADERAELVPERQVLGAPHGGALEAGEIQIMERSECARARGIDGAEAQREVPVPELAEQPLEGRHQGDGRGRVHGARSLARIGARGAARLPVGDALRVRAVPTLTVHHLGPDQALDTGGLELAARPGLRWVDVVGPDEALLNALKPLFGLHRLAIEDCLHLDQRPKLEEFKGHLFLVLHGFEAKSGSAELELEMQELHLFLGPDWVMTVHDGRMGSVEALRGRLLKDPAEVLGRGADHLAYLLTDGMVDADFPLVERINELIDGLEDQLFSGFKPGQQLQLFAVKRQLVTLRRILSPQRDVIALLSRPGMPHVQERTTFYFRDVHDHLIRLHEQIDAGRDILGNLMDAYLSVVALRTGDISKQLTVIATIFLPLTFLTGFFGMNFDVLSKREYLYFVLGCAVTLPITLVAVFRRKGWF